MAIQIDIQKKLPEFELRIALSSARDHIGILGASGAGKSMLLRCIAGLVRPDAGRILIHGKTFFDSEKRVNLPPRERGVGFLFQNYALFPHLTIRENITFGLEHLSESIQDKRASELMERFHLSEMSNRYPVQISGGQQQRVALARALAAQPAILLLDEPLSALDDHLRSHMLKEMQEFLKGFQGSTLYVTHSMEEAYRLCDRLAIVSAGKVEAFGQKQVLFEHPGSLEAARITGCKNIAPAVRVSERTLHVPGWGLSVETAEPIPESAGFVGIRANHIHLAADRDPMNCFPAWIADESEAPFRTTLYLKIGSEPKRADDFHLQWEVSREEARAIISHQQPVWIEFDPKHILVFKET